MDIHLPIFDMIPLGLKLVQHKIQQYRLATNETVVLPTNYGQVKGIKRRTVYDGSYYAFEGIPYAKPPVGELRFRAPQPPEPWLDERDCTNYSYKPMQKHFVLGIKEGSEDCLYLNVYARNLQTDKPLPVLVWIYGGGFQIGEATRDLYAPDYFMQQDVVLVTFNYRVGVLGFLSLKDPDLDVPGNAGLKDQVLALRWIKSNIRQFNGDADNITLMGQSAGGGSTHFMMLTDKTRNLFHKAILMSGTALCPWALTPDRDWAYRLSRKLGYIGENNDKAVFRYLSQMSGPKLTGIDNQIRTKEEIQTGFLFSFTPVVEPYVSESCLIAKPIKELLEKAWGNEIPVILGGTSTEGLFALNHMLRNTWEVDELGDCGFALPNEVKRQHDTATLKEMAAKLKRTYFGDKQPSAKESTFQYLELFGYKHFWHGLHRALLARIAYASTTPTYLYRFDFDSPHFNHYRILSCGKQVRGVAHADDLSYLFYNISASKLPKASPEYRTIERMIGMWTSFAATSNPNCPQIAPAIWQPVQGGDAVPKCLNISENMEFIDLAEIEKLQLWNSFFEKGSLF